MLVTTLHPLPFQCFGQNGVVVVVNPVPTAQMVLDVIVHRLLAAAIGISSDTAYMNTRTIQRIANGITLVLCSFTTDFKCRNVKSPCCARVCV